MANSTRIDALSIELQSSTTKALLKEEYGKVIDNIQHITLASVLKNKDLSGDPTAGTVEAKRFVNVAGATYGTARAGHQGNAIKEATVVIAIDDDREYIEEVEEKDLAMYGVSGLIARRTANHKDMEAVDEDTKFLAEAGTVATSVTVTGLTEWSDKISKAITTLETLKNDFVQGVPRNKIAVVCTPDVYDALREKINNVPNSQNLGAMANYEQGIYKNTRIYSSVFMPSGVNALIMVDGAVAQPVKANSYGPEQIPFSEATGFGLFVHKGTKAVTPDCIFKV